LREKCGEDLLLADADALQTYGTDWTRVYAANPGGVALPRTTAEVSAILRLCSEHSIAVVPSGGRTGLAGGAVAARGELVLSLSRMNRMDEVNAVAGSVDVEAGAITEMVHRHVEDAGWIWPIDLAAKGSSQIGGNLATNAGGLRVIRYGSTRKWVLGLTCVLMDGRILELGGLEKDNTGYDLTQLMIGSEGTLGVITRATLKLAPKPKPTQVILFALSEPAHALAILSHVRTRGDVVAAYELWTDACRTEVEAASLGRSPFQQAAPIYALLELEQGPEQEGLASLLSELSEKDLILDAVTARSAAQMRELWSLREHITLSLSRREMMHKSDIAVPVGKIATLFTELTRIFEASYPDLEVFLFGHVGDGNVHVNVAKPASWDKEAFLLRIAQVDQDIGALLQRLGGSVSAEHGIGLLKKTHLHFTRSQDELAIFRAIKAAFDPRGLLNPGKLIDP
jgi:FAD/FMN-containing dehydrogenase